MAEVEHRSKNSAPRVAVGLVVAGGAAWILVALVGAVDQAFFGVLVLGTSGASGDLGYPTQAASDLLWAGYGVAILGAGVGLFAIAIGLTAFRNGERWAWFAIWTLPLIGALIAWDDERQFGGWWTFLWSGLPALLGAVVSFRATFPPRDDGQPRADHRS